MGTLHPHIGRYLAESVGIGRLTPHTARNQQIALRGFADTVGNRPARVVARRDVERWLATLRGAPTTRRTRLSAVRAWCRWLVEHRVLPRDPTVGVPSPKVPRRVPRALPAASVTRLYAACPDARARAVVALMVELGLRCGEVAALELGDWDRWGATMLLRGKGGHERVVPVTGRASQALDAYLADHPASAGPLVRSYTSGGALTAQAVSKMVGRWMVAAGIKGPGVSAHALRHTAASEVLEACGDVTVVQELLGHRDLSTTAIYLRRASLGRLREAMAAREAA